MATNRNRIMVAEVGITRKIARMFEEQLSFLSMVLQLASSCFVSREKIVGRLEVMMKAVMATFTKENLCQFGRLEYYNLGQVFVLTVYVLIDRSIKLFLVFRRLQIGLWNAKLLNAAQGNAKLLNAAQGNAKLLNAAQGNAKLLNEAQGNAMVCTPSINHHHIFKILNHNDNESHTIGEAPLPKSPIPAERKQSRPLTQKFPVWRGLKKKGATVQNQ